MAGDHIAELYRQWGPAIYRRCLRLLHDQEAARDATQEVFRKALASPDKLADPETALPFIYRVAMNHCLNERRNRGRRGETELADFDVVWFLAPRPSTWYDTMYFVLGEDVQGVMLPRRPGEIQAGLLLPKGEWRSWRQRGLGYVASRVRRLDPIFAEFANGLRDFGAFFPLSGELRLMRD